jgi:enoyl-CoA hydratase
VDGPTAAALRAAFDQFEADDSLAVAVFTGGGGQFCAGADLKAVADPAAAATRPPPTAAGPARWGRPASTSASR